MTGVMLRTLLSVAIAGSTILGATAAVQAHDDDRWDRERWEHRRHEGPVDRYRPVYPARPIHPVHNYVVEAPPRVVYERPAPVVVMPAPAVQAPAYAPPVAPGLNLNFTIPLR